MGGSGKHDRAGPKRGGNVEKRWRYRVSLLFVPLDLLRWIAEIAWPYVLINNRTVIVRSSPDACGRLPDALYAAQPQHLREVPIPSAEEDVVPNLFPVRHLPPTVKHVLPGGHGGQREVRVSLDKLFECGRMLYHLVPVHYSNANVVEGKLSNGREAVEWPIGGRLIPRNVHVAETVAPANQCREVFVGVRPLAGTPVSTGRANERSDEYDHRRATHVFRYPVEHCRLPERPSISLLGISVKAPTEWPDSVQPVPLAAPGSLHVGQRRGPIPAVVPVGLGIRHDGWSPMPRSGPEVV